MIHDTQLHGATERFLMDLDADRHAIVDNVSAAIARLSAAADWYVADRAAQRALDEMKGVPSC